MTDIRLHKGDISQKAAAYYQHDIAIDCETLGLVQRRDRLCVVQLSPGDGSADIIQIEKGQSQAPHLLSLLSDPKKVKLFHYGRFDIAILYHTFNITCAPVFCTKIASRLTRTYTDRHGLKDVCRELLCVELSKQQQSSDWAVAELTEAQLAYAASDVIYLHQLRDKMAINLEREDRMAYAQECFNFLPTRAKLDLLGWEETDIFAHS